MDNSLSGSLGISFDQIFHEKRNVIRDDSTVIRPALAK
jgi:hypothetical protein